MIRIKSLFFLISVIVFSVNGYNCYSQDKKGIYVDSKGVIRWEKSNEEASFFGVNYTVPFAYGYRSHKVLGVNPEKAIQQDVYHLARMGIDAFRVHVWDTEITDSAGNLLQNEHLRLFDFLLAELKKRNIKTLVTPIAFWGNGYPEKDEKTPGFSAKYGKGPSVVAEEAIKAQENYLKQFFQHVNPYTKTSYLNDPDIIATEINNEPRHSGPKSGTKDYVNRLAAAIRSTGWAKPVFYNISESPWYADAVANANIDGVSFQWYPSGLVANHTLKGNFLPHVDKYAIPFDTIPAYKNKARMVYEFDSGDIFQPIMYPAMARSFRTAGFQWATQFAYDPMATAYANTEYQTHYLNLAYTPAKAISLMIANKVFHKVPRMKSYGTYPASNSFEVFRIDYRTSLSEMNAPEEFYYSNTTSTKPVSPSKLTSIAGVGSSAVVQYRGTGAYFLDKLESGIWRLEVMPDAIHIRDPFERASLKKEVTRIEWRNQPMSIKLSDLGEGFEIKALNENNSLSSKAVGNDFTIYPGTYLLVKKGKSTGKIASSAKIRALGLNEFVAPQPVNTSAYVRHQPFTEVSAGKDFTISAIVAGFDKDTKVLLQINQLGGRYKTFTMTSSEPYQYTAQVPADFVNPGMLNYRIIVQQGEEYLTFPGEHTGNPFAWDNFINEPWKTFVAAPESDIEIYNASKDQQIRVIPNWDDNVKRGYTSSVTASQLLLRMQTEKLSDVHILGFQSYIADKLSGRASEMESFRKLVFKGKGTNGARTKLKMSLINSTGQAFSGWIDLTTDLSEREILLSAFIPDSALLLPRPYPGFHPLWFKPSTTENIRISDIEKLEISVGSELKGPELANALGFEIESVRLSK